MTRLDQSSPFNEAEAQATAERMIVLRGGKEAALANAEKHATAKKTDSTLRPFWARVAEILRA